ncbi:rod shape-determining protein MreD [bacterium Unc6]|nr:rod shape-determining protein MreD [bacterium Unc6]
MYHLNPFWFAIFSILILWFDISFFRTTAILYLYFLYIILFQGKDYGLWCGAWVGFLIDISCPDPLGTHTGTLGTVGHILGKYARVLKKDAWFVQVSIAFLSILAAKVLSLSLLFIFTDTVVLLRILENVFIKSFGIALLTPFVFYIFGRLKK